jgi:hypothetical protein
LAYWFGDNGCWFVDVILPIYIIAPFWKMLFDKFDSWVTQILFTGIIICLMLSVPTGPVQGGLSQGAFFFLGFLLARYVVDGFKVTIPQLCGVFSIILIGFALYYYCGVGKLLYLLLIPFIVIACGFINALKSKFILTLLNSLGKISLESYLFNTTLIFWIVNFNLLPASMWHYRYCFIVIVGIALSYAVSHVSSLLTKRIFR